MKPLVQQGFLVIKRINWFADRPADQPVPQKDPTIPLSHDLILEAYSGFEGRAWPHAKTLDVVGLVEGLMPHTQMGTLETYVSDVSKICPVSVLYCQVGATGPLPMRLSGKVNFAGFDFGVFDPIEDSFSVVFNEVIYGNLPGMGWLAKRLNHCLLLKTLEDIELVASTRQCLQNEGADLERMEGDEKPVPVAMYRTTTL